MTTKIVILLLKNCGISNLFIVTFSQSEIINNAISVIPVYELPEHLKKINPDVLKIR